MAEFVLGASTYITASGENTTFQLTPPGEKTTGDFQAGRIQDDENPTDAVDLGEDKYTEIEFCIQPTDEAEVGETYEFRLTKSDLWLPTDIGGCKRWGRSDLGITMDGSNRVSIFADQSGNGNDFTQATDAKKYIWTPNEINGHAALVGDGVDDEMRADTLCQFVYSLKPFTLFSVWRNVDVISWEYPSSWYCGTAGGMPDTLLFWLNANEIRIYRRLISNNYVGAAYTPGNWGYWILTFDGRYYNLRINGVPIIVNADFLDFDLGTGLDQFIIRSIKEKLHWAEDTFYDNAISAPNIALLESYAATRYTI